jgi:hypothetical protein
MIRFRGLWTGLVLGSAIISHQSLAQSGSSVSLTHVVSVTVPPRVKAQITHFAPAAQTATRVSSIRPATDGLVITVNATQAWTLTIGSAAGKSTRQWSHDAASGFAKLDGTGATIASGTISQIPTAAAIFFRNAAAAPSDRKGGEDSEPVMLTVAAQ